MTQHACWSEACLASYLLTTVSFITLALCGVPFGYLSDKIGRKPLLLCGCLLSIIVGFILFNLLMMQHHWVLWLFGIVIGVMVAMVNGVYAVTISEQFAPELRASGMGLSYNLGFALFGGLAPVISTFFVKILGSGFAPYYYFLLCAVLTLLASCLLVAKKTGAAAAMNRGEPLG